MARNKFTVSRNLECKANAVSSLLSLIICRNPVSKYAVYVMQYSGSTYNSWINDTCQCSLKRNKKISFLQSPSKSKNNFLRKQIICSDN